MMFIKEIKEGFLYGKAINCFNKKNYKNAIQLFEKVLDIDSQDDRKEYIYYYLGRSYFALGLSKEARETMTISYEMFRDRFKNESDSESNEEDVKYFIALTNEYISLLSKLDERKLAKQIMHDRDQILIAMGYNLDT